ncbi:hypothetical protein H632_c1867p1 [Helicosporidium sp. ATCC 50920]|nr:hypothetical protein H632_c1867p1 [Helicosporidium sp. ATCC 50920]|eukprot:KDD73753.1 hypothetical protein H632_c1867p1 [Helicosporidium sp. ATCC 50920]
MTPEGASPFAQTPEGVSPGCENASAYHYAVYVESWKDPQAASAEDSHISSYPAYADYLLLSYMLPDATYNGGMTFEGTGLQFSSSATVVKGAMDLLKLKHPGTKFLVTVGGPTYNNWQALNPAAVAKFVKEFGLDGVVIDYVPVFSECKEDGDKIKCSTDDEYVSAIRSLRKALPDGSTLATSVPHVGAYGLGEWKNAPPKSKYTGMAIRPLEEAGGDLNFVMIKSYDAGNSFDPKEALNAYLNHFTGDILLGVEVAPEACEGRDISLEEVDSLTAHVEAKRAAGMVLFGAYKIAKPGTPTGKDISERICQNLGLKGCGGSTKC